MLVQPEVAALCGLRQLRAQQLLGTHLGGSPGGGCCLVAMCVTAGAGTNEEGTACVLVGAPTCCYGVPGGGTVLVPALFLELQDLFYLGPEGLVLRKHLSLQMYSWPLLLKFIKL